MQDFSFSGFISIEGKWGIEKIVDVDYVNPAEGFTNSYGCSKSGKFQLSEGIWQHSRPFCDPQ